MFEIYFSIIGSRGMCISSVQNVKRVFYYFIAIIMLLPNGSIGDCFPGEAAKQAFLCAILYATKPVVRLGT